MNLFQKLRLRFSKLLIHLTEPYEEKSIRHTKMRIHSSKPSEEKRIRYTKLRTSVLITLEQVKKLDEISVGFPANKNVKRSLKKVESLISIIDFAINHNTQTI